MLERVTLIPDDASLGNLAEAMVYYGHVDVAFRTMLIVDLVRSLGIDGVVRLAESHAVRFVFDRTANAVATDETRFFPHEFISVHLHKTAEGRAIRSTFDELDEAFRNHIGSGAIPRRKVRRLAEAIYTREQRPSSVGKGAISDVLDREFLTAAVRLSLNHKVPEYPHVPGIFAEGSSEGTSFYIATNVDYPKASEMYARRLNDSSLKLGAADLVAPIIAMRADMHDCGGEKTDVWADDLRSSLLTLRVDSFLSRLEGGRNNVERFHNVTFPSRSFSEAVESGERTIIDVLEFCEDPETRKFKLWVQQGPHGGDLLAEYEKSKIAPSKLAASLPYKTTKMVLFSAAGAFLDGAIGGTGAVGGTLGGLASNLVMGAADELLAKHLRLGWRPNQWVSRTASPFLRAR